MKNPYISIVFANRNDGYTSDQRLRISNFIDFYSYYDKKYPGLFEFVICDWNPPENTPPLRDEYEWTKLDRVIHLVVPKQIHSELCPDHSRPILDYTARNACIRRASAPFILVINQDIFLSASILKFLSQRQLSSNCFYRADRCDFKFDYKEGFADWEHFDEYAITHALQKHIRTLSYKEEGTLAVNKKNFSLIRTTRSNFEYKINNVIYSRFYQLFRSFSIIVLKLLNRLGCKKNCSYKRFGLHTNASGDFLLAAKQAFYDVHGFVETYHFYMHLDSYMCAQLFAAGYRQVILSGNHLAFHSDHSRSARESRPESMGYHDHAKIFRDICLGKRSYKINQKSWGLESLNL